jgi:hypothetical protein
MHLQGLRARSRALAVGAAVTAVAGGLAVPSLAADWSKTTPPDMSTLFKDPAYVASAAKALAAHQADMARLTSPSERSARVRSRRQFHGLPAASAQDLAQQRFPGLTTSSLDTLGLPSGVAVEDYLAPEVARVVNDSGKASLMVATEPLAAQDASGRLQAIDLTLQSQGSDFVAKRAANPLAIPHRSGGFLTFDHSDLGVRPAGADVAGLRQDDRVFYGGVATDTDYIAMPTRSGAEVMWQLRSSAAGEQLPLDVKLPQGATLRLASSLTAPVGSTTDAGPAGVEVVMDGKVIGTISAPKAFDADGTAVPASYTVDGDRVTVDVPHQGKDYKYPIAVDPEVHEVWGGGDFGNGCGGAGARGWHVQGWGTAMNWSCYDSRYGGGGLYVTSTSPTWYANDSRTQFYWGTPAYVHIISAWADGVWARTVGSHMYDGIAGPYGWEAIANDYGDSMNGQVSHVANPGNDTNSFVFGLYMDCCWNDPRPYEGLAAIRGANIRIGDYYPPSDVKLTGITPSLSQNWAGIPATPWVSGMTTVTGSASASDAGLGINNVGVMPMGHDWFTGHNLIACNGYITSPCPNSASWSGAFDLQQRKGLVSLQAFATDITENPGYGPQFIVKVDRDNPVVGMDGDVVTHATDGNLPPNPTVHVHVTDGSDASAETFQSGVKRVLVTLDGATVNDWNNTNGDGTNNDFDWNYTLNVTGSNPQHTLLVRAYDYLGQMGTYTQTFNYVANSTSLTYGGSDYSVNTEDEAEAVETAEATGDANALWAGLSPADQAAWPTLNPAMGCIASAAQDGISSQCADDDITEDDDDPDVTFSDETTDSTSAIRPLATGHIAVINVSGGGWTTIRNRYQSYVIGNAADDDHMHVYGEKQAFHSGEVGGDFNWHCGWVKTSNSPVRLDDPVSTDCGPDYRPSVYSFASRVNCKHCTFGEPVRLRSDAGEVHECANVLPTPNGNTVGCRVAIQTLTADQVSRGYTVHWRYLTRDSQYVMVNDTHNTSNRGRWVFIRKSAFDHLPATPASEDHKPEKN